MKFPKIILLLFFLKVISIVAQSNWLNSEPEALNTSKIENKPILLIYHSDISPIDAKMELSVWDKESIKKLQKNFISLQLKRKEVTYFRESNYYKDSVGTISILDSWGNKLYETYNYENEISVKNLLNEFSINMSNINAAMTILEKDVTNEYSNIRVAEKFQDKVPFLEGNAKKSFILRSNFYLKEGGQLISKENRILSERGDLLKMLNKVYFGGGKKVSKKIKNRFSNVNDSNLPLYNYLRLVCYNSIGDIQNRDKAYNELISNNNLNYISKAEVIIKKINKLDFKISEKIVVLE